MDSYYTQYYLRQKGAGLSDIGPLYKTPVFYQRGSGIGSFFSGLFKHLKPLVSSGIDALKNQSLKTSSAILNDIGKKPFKEILKEQGKVAVKDLTEKGINKLKRMNEQKGGSRKKHIKRRKLSLKRNTKQLGKGRRHRRVKSNKKKRTKKLRVVDIFNN